MQGIGERIESVLRQSKASQIPVVVIPRSMKVGTTRDDQAVLFGKNAVILTRGVEVRWVKDLDAVDPAGNKLQEGPWVGERTHRMGNRRNASGISDHLYCLGNRKDLARHIGRT